MVLFWEYPRTLIGVRVDSHPQHFGPFLIHCAFDEEWGYLMAGAKKNKNRETQTAKLLFFSK